MRISDWSSDVCSSDLDCKPGAHANGPGPTSAERPTPRPIMGRMTGPPDRPGGSGNGPVVDDGADALRLLPGLHGADRRIEACQELRSEERRVGKEWLSPCRSRGAP